MVCVVWSTCVRSWVASCATVLSLLVLGISVAKWCAVTLLVVVSISVPIVRLSVV